MSIKPLPGHVVAQIKSSVVITSLNNVVTGLVKNSLDAEATKINIFVDYSRGSCSVEDNGVGIPPSEFRADGGLGQLHYTSRFPAHPDIHGRNGVFLASGASLSLLSITSRHRDFHSHNSLSIHNSTVLARSTPCPPEQRLLTFTHGTRVTVRDLFGSMPVRVKHRAIQAEKSSFTRDRERLVLDIVALLIAWPGAVSISIRDAASRQPLTLKVSSDRQRWVNDSCRLLHQASLCGSPRVSDWVAIGASSPTLSVSGYVCREPVATKRAQFISLGIEPLSNELRSNVLYEEANKVFADSSFGLIEDEIDDDKNQKIIKKDSFTQRELKARKGLDRWPMFFLKMTPTNSSPSLDEILDDQQPNLATIIDLLKAMFFEYLKRDHCRPRKVVLSSDAKSRSGKQHGISHRPDDVASAASSNKRSKTTSRGLALAGNSALDDPKLEMSVGKPETLFANWSRIKSGKPMHSFEEPASSRSGTTSGFTTPTQRSRNSTPGHTTDMLKASCPTESFQPSLFDGNGKLTRKPFDDIDHREVMSRNVPRDPQPERAPMETEEATALPEAPHRDETVDRVKSDNKTITDISPPTGSHSKSEETSRGAEETTRGTKATTSWVTDLISKWKNPVFELTEPPIPKLPDVAETLGLDSHATGHQCYHGQPAFTMGTRHETTAMGLQGRLSKDTLRKAQLVAQVDRKYILAKVPFNRVTGGVCDDSAPVEASTVLLLVDQHAADERCRVEELMAGYFEPSSDSNGKQVWVAVTNALQKPVQFELSGHDADLLRQFQPHCSYWGILYDVEDSAWSNRNKKTSRGTKVKITVRSLPPAILERCRTDPRLLAELIRKEAWRLKDEDRLAQLPTPRPVLPKGREGSVPAWVPLFHACPPGILELVNSRSCRSAIMFNDPLTMEECSQLLDKLIRCSFPFQCAHGRPSMVPLVDLGEESVQLGNLGESSPVDVGGEAFGQAYTKWKEIRGFNGSRYSHEVYPRTW